jgi:hypothetical protein
MARRGVSMLLLVLPHHFVMLKASPRKGDSHCGNRESSCGSFMVLFSLIPCFSRKTPEIFERGSPVSGLRHG